MLGIDLLDEMQRMQEEMERFLRVPRLGGRCVFRHGGEVWHPPTDVYETETDVVVQMEVGGLEEGGFEICLDGHILTVSGERHDPTAKLTYHQLERLAKMPTAAAEYSVIKTYLDWLTDLPWNVATEDNLDIARARRILDEDHYDLEEIKERILEYLAVRKMRLERQPKREEAEEEPRDYIRKERQGAILCFVGPPGTGKTSLGQSIARALGRKFVRMSLGGVRDEAGIRGFRRTYVGALPGRIIQAIRRVGSKNPVFMLDEVDKVGTDWRGDPSSALLEVLDPEQNTDFRDHYLDVPFDLSQVMFITTANTLTTIPAPLLDRMEVLDLDGYIEEEKIRIAQQYLIPRQLRENALQPEEIKFTEEALQRIIRDYTREAGVRNLERQIGSVCRKVITKVAEGHTGPIVVTEDDVTEYLGKPRFFSEVAERTEIPGVATGLVVTPVGGDITFVEATRMKGKGGFTITGQLGDVMKESAQAALSYIRAKARELGLDEDAFAESDIHIHVPVGAIPKDGPSAGVTMATALASLFSGRPVRSDLAMTGEITLRGQVLPVGGIKQKVLAAYQAGLETVVLPKRNEVDLDDLPQEAREKMHFILVDKVDQVIASALRDGRAEPKI